MTRTFLALELPDPVRAALAREIARLTRGLGQSLPPVRWVDPAGMHLTLAFLGELDDAGVQAAIEAAEQGAASTRPFRVALAGPGYFGPRSAPRVIWAGVGGETRALVAAQAQLADALAARGFPRESRPFAPHLTLARVKQALPPAELERLLAALSRSEAGDTAAMTVDGIVVMKSELRPGGARYTPLARCPFEPA